MSFHSVLTLALGAILVENFVLVKFLGICPFMGVSKRMDTAVGMGFAVIFVMTVASACTFAIDKLLVWLELTSLRTVAFILVIAALVQLVEMFLAKVVPALHEALGIYLPLITTNCAVLGVALLNTRENYNLVESVVNGVAAAAGFTLAIVIFASIRERLEANANFPAWMNGFPGALITAGLMSIAFQGFSGLLH